MCGFVGFLGGALLGDAAAEHALIRRMTDTIAHRGPDDAGYWCDVEQRIALGHRRLSIVDLSQAGHQPMFACSARYVLALNGEIYNHLILRQELASSAQGPIWRGHSDTETLLAGFDAWGIQSTVERAIGMFAFAAWDRQERTLTLARDRIGEKPLYCGWQGEVFLFGSELKALRAHPAFRGEIDRGALTLLLRHNYIPVPYSIYRGIGKLTPGCLYTVSLRERQLKVHTYWSGIHVVESGVADVYTGSSDDAVCQLETLLKDAVSHQMVADVPLGAFLSGGVDSATVVALMQAQSSRPIKTFSIGFREPGYNEAEYAKAVARHLGTDHTELYVTPAQAMAVIPQLPTLYDEPFADSSQIPTFLVAQLARRQVTVSLSGDAGDELFCGYNRYQFTAQMWRRLSSVPVGLRALAAACVTRVSPQVWNRIFRATQNVMRRSAGISNVGHKLHKGAGVLASSSAAALYLGLVSHWPDPASVVIGGHEPPTLLTGSGPRLRGLDEVQRMMALDLLTYLPDDILVKVDRAAMGVSLETRVPFLDHRVVEFAWRLPQSLKIRNGQTKWVLRQILYKYVPRELIERPKAGFGIPIDSWLRGPLRDWAESLLDERRLREEGFFNPEPIITKWREHLSGDRNWQYHLWDVLIFQAFLGNSR